MANNQQLVNNDTGQIVNNPTPVSNPELGLNYPGLNYTPNPVSTIPAAQTAPTPSLNIASTIPPTTTSGAAAMVAGAGQASNDIATTVAESSKPLTSEQIAAKSLTDELSNLYSQDTGKASALNAAETAQGVPDLTKQLNDINNEMKIKTAEYDQLNANLEANAGKMGWTTSMLTGQQGAVLKQKAADIGLLSARAQALQGNITLAKETAAKAVDLKYSPIEDQIKTTQAQLDLLRPTLDKQDKAQADALAQQHQQELQKIADEKQKAKDNVSTALNLGITTRFAERAGEYFDTLTGQAFPDAQSFYKAAGVSSFVEADHLKLVTHITSAMLNPPKSGSGPLPTGYPSTGQIEDWLLKNKQANPNIPYYDLWGQLADQLKAKGINPTNFDKQFWTILSPDGLAGYNAAHPNSSSSSTDLFNQL